MLHILFISGSVAEATQYMLIAKELKSHNIETHIATTRKNVCDFLKKENFDKTFHMEVKKPKNPVIPKLYSYLKKYTNPTLAEMLFSEQTTRTWSDNQRIALLCEFLDIYEKYFSAHNIRCICKMPTCSFAGRAAFAVAKSKNIPTIIINTGPIVTETFTMNDMDEGWLWSEFFNSYKNKTSLTLTEKQETDTAINKIIKDKNDSLKIKYPNPKSALKLILLSAYHALQNKFDYTEINELKKELLFLKSFFFTSAKYTNFSNENSDYIFFPLHIPWDAQIATRNPMFYSQEAIVEMLANACPPNINIYVKEHPYYHGNVNNEIFKTIKKHTNVKLIHPSVSSADLIKNSKAVVTINSTAGWESILFKKPLIVLGNPFYAYFKYAYKVENINTLPKLLNEAIEKGEKIYSDKDEWYKFINGAILSSHKGSFVLYKKYMGFAKDLTEKRIKLLANELSEKINELTNCQHR